MRKLEIITLGIVLFSFAVAIYFYPQMPDELASHWNFRGEVDGYLSKFWGLFLMPFISLAMFLLFLIIPKIDPMKANIEKFRKYFDWFILIIIIFLFYLYFLTIVWNLGFRFGFIRLLAPAFGFLFYYAGVLVKNAKRNWFIGIRTPWTLSNEKVWEKTHQLGGKLFKLAGIIALLGIFFPGLALFFILIPVLSVTIYTIIYSYVEYQKEIKL